MWSNIKKAREFRRLFSFRGLLSPSAAAVAYQVDDDQYYADDDERMNDRRGEMKCKKSEQPQHYQNQSYDQ